MKKVLLLTIVLMGALFTGEVNGISRDDLPKPVQSADKIQHRHEKPKRCDLCCCPVEERSQCHHICDELAVVRAEKETCQAVYVASHGCADLCAAVKLGANVVHK